jgi:hypothetical protein
MKISAYVERRYHERGLELTPLGGDLLPGRRDP